MGRVILIDHVAHLTQNGHSCR